MCNFKKNAKQLFVVLILLLPLAVCSQNFKERVSEIASKLESVEASKVQFSQDLKTISSGYVVLTLTQLDAKGNTEVINYEFSFSDIDINTVRTTTQKDIISVQLLIKGKQKLIKKIADAGDKVSYIDAVSIYAKDIDNGRDLVNSIKEIIPLNETIEKNKLALTTYDEHLQWLINNVTEVDYSKRQYAQKLTNDSRQDGYGKLEAIISEKSKSKNTSSEFNFATLNPNSIDFKIKSDEFYIEVDTRRSLKTIKNFENDIQKNFTNSLKFYASSVENGKDIYKVLKAIIPLAEEAFLKGKPNIDTKSSAIQYLNKIIANVSGADKALVQSIKDDCVTEFSFKMTTSKNDEDHLYVFNFIDINSDNIEYNSQKDLLFVSINTSQKSKYIRHVENGVLQNYTDEVRLYVNSVEEAMLTKEAIQTIIKDCKSTLKSYDTISEQQGLEQLIDAIGIVKINDDNYEQSLELLDEASRTVRFTDIFSNLKKSEEEVFEYGLKDINSKSILMKTSGKNVLVELSTKYFEKIIKTYEDGEIKSYGNKISIQASSIENAREIVNLFKIITKD